MKPPIIDHNPQAPARKRLGRGFLTAVAWLVYAYLWTPLITALGWLLGVRWAHKQLAGTKPLEDPFVVLSLPVIALVCGLLMVGWAEYNRRKFMHADRRRRRHEVDPREVAKAFGVSDQTAHRLRTQRISHVALDEDAYPQEIQARQE